MNKIIGLLLVMLTIIMIVFKVSAYSYSKNHYTYQISDYDTVIESGMTYRTNPKRHYKGDTIRIKDHVVYQRSDDISQPDEPLYYTVVDYFDTDEAERNATSIRIRDTIDGLPVKEISVFYRDTKKRALIPNKEDCLPQITKLTIPDSVAVISDYALSYFSSLKALRLPKELRVLGIGACCGMDALEQISIPSGVERIGEYALYDCPNLKKVTFEGNALSLIDSRAFGKCTALTSIKLPASLQHIEDSAFLGCDNLVKMNLQFTQESTLFSDSTFLNTLSPKCCVLVLTKAMKDAVKQTGFQGVVKVKVPVKAPNRVTIKAKGSSLQLKWSKVLQADGYRVYKYNEAAQQYTKLKTLHGADSNTLRLVCIDETYAVRAFRIVDGDVSWSSYRTQ